MSAEFVPYLNPFTGEPYVIPEKGSPTCPGSIYIRTSNDLCLCGLPREAHVWENRNGIIYPVQP